MNLKVKSTTAIKSLAGAIAQNIKSIKDTNKYEELEISCIGAGAVNQAVKSIIVAKTLLIANGIDFDTIPTFTRIIIDEGVERTGIKFLLTLKNN
jgi:stage V sporulation protein SpoVS